MGPLESLVNSFVPEHMGRSEAPLSIDYREETLGGVSSKKVRVGLSRMASRLEIMSNYATVRFRGVDYKYNRQGGWDLDMSSTPTNRNSIQTTLLEVPPLKN